jgi:hypothetical protein
VKDQKIRIRRHSDLDDAVAGARKRSSGDAWAWARRDQSVDVSPLVAVTLAVWVGCHTVAAPSTYNEERGMRVLE